METLRNVQPTARKEHKCEYCGGIIHVGEKYDRQTNVFDGHIYDWICHKAWLKETHESLVRGRNLATIPSL